MSNHPPYAVLNLDKDDHAYLTALIDAANKQAKTAQKDIAGMPSSDERAKFRASLMIAAAADLYMTERLAEMLQDAKGAL